MPPTDKQLAELMQQLQQTNENLSSARQELTQTTTVLRQSIQEQTRLNSRFDRVIEDHDKRLGSIERWRSAIDQRLPKTLLDGDELHDDMDDIRAAVDGLKWRIATWSGGIAVLVFALGWVAKVVLL